MTPDLETLGRRVMTWAHFQWRPGMFVVHPEGNAGHGYVYRLKSTTPRGPNDYPDVSNPSTQARLAVLKFLAGPKTVNADGTWSFEIVRRNRRRTNEEFVADLEVTR
jgi:hypothetical protein